MYKDCKNKVFLSGKISEPKWLFNDVYGATLEVKRFSGTSDYIPIQFNRELFPLIVGNNRFVKIKGFFKSFSKNSSLILYVWAKEIIPLSEELYENKVELKGYLCRKSTLRQTPLTNRTIFDFFIATNHKDVSYYFPIISWNTLATNISDLPLSTHVFLTGRIQSREYVKVYDDNTQETKTAYEVSTYYLELA